MVSPTSTAVRLPRPHSLPCRHQVDCVDQAELIELIFMECEADFGDINFYFGGEDFTLTVKRKKKRPCKQ